MSDDKKSVGKNILEKIITVIRDDSRALSEAVMDSTGSRLYEKQIEVSKENLRQAKSAITDELAKELQSSRKVKILNDRVNQQEQLIIEALSRNDEDLAFNLATEMVELEQDQAAELTILKSHELHLGHLTRRLENAERTLKDLERQMAMVQTTEDIQKATDVITKSFSQAMPRCYQPNGPWSGSVKNNNKLMNNMKWMNRCMVIQTKRWKNRKKR